MYTNNNCPVPPTKNQIRLKSLIFKFLLDCLNSECLNGLVLFKIIKRVFNTIDLYSVIVFVSSYIKYNKVVKPVSVNKKLDVQKNLYFWHLNQI